MYRVLYRIYQFLLGIIEPVARALSTISPKVRRFHRGRSVHDPAWQQVVTACEEAREDRRAVVLWFCSSAGEFEQALPVMARLPGAAHMVVFFSQSGLDYVARRYPDVLAVKAPYDKESKWREVFDRLRPALTVIVRYELWPAFLRTAKNAPGATVLIDGSIAPDYPPTGMGRWLRQRLLAEVDEVFVTDDDQPAAFQHYYGCAALAVGDSKYDRVFDRKAELLADTHPDLQSLAAAVGSRRVLMVGSGWPADISPILTAQKKLNDEAWVVVIAPHDISSAMMAWVKNACAELGLSSQFLSGLAAQHHRDEDGAVLLRKADAGSEPCQVIIVDKLGVLFELYHAAHLVFVGGGMDRRVHNVLEPAVYTVPLAFGPGYHHSGEAVRLVEAGLATVVSSSAEMASWWQGFPHADQVSMMQKAMAGWQGASGRIAAKLQKRLQSQPRA